MSKKYIDGHIYSDEKYSFFALYSNGYVTNLINGYTFDIERGIDSETRYFLTSSMVKDLGPIENYDMPEYIMMYKNPKNTKISGG